jgi:hypothetical protein
MSSLATGYVSIYIFKADKVFFQSHSAKQMENGSQKYGVCVAAEENTKKLLRLMKG